jgi:hypothetical protein
VIRQPTSEWVCPESPITPSIASLSCAWNLEIDSIPRTAWAGQLKHQSGSLASVLGVKRDYTHDPGGTVTRQNALLLSGPANFRVVGNPARMAPIEFSPAFFGGYARETECPELIARQETSSLA